MKLFSQYNMTRLRFGIVIGLCCGIFLCSLNALAADNTRMARFQDAASAYSKGNYEQAIKGFESLTLEGGVSAPLLYNLGNSYAQTGQIGKAILNYERALRLTPGDSDVRGNLELIRKDKGLFQEEQSFGQRFVTFFGLNQWLMIASIFFVLFIGALFAPVSPGLKRSIRNGTAVACLLVTITAGAGSIGQYQYWHEGVVVIADARLRVSPFESAASIGTIQEGRLVYPGKVHNKYVLVVDEAKRSGWLKRDAFEAVTASYQAFP